MDLSYGEVERLIASLHDVPPERNSALRARLKHLKRLGFPAGVNTGAGVAASYKPAALIDLLLLFEILQFGVPPERGIQLIRAHGAEIELATRKTGEFQQLIGGKDADWRRDLDPDGAVLIVFEPTSLSKTLSVENTDMKWANIRVIRGCDLHNGNFAYDYVNIRRLAVINVSNLILSAWIELSLSAKKNNGNDPQA
jgi:hypothetical protein